MDRIIEIYESLQDGDLVRICVGESDRLGRYPFQYYGKVSGKDSVSVNIDGEKIFRSEISEIRRFTSYDELFEYMKKNGNENDFGLLQVVGKVLEPSPYNGFELQASAYEKYLSEHPETESDIRDNIEGKIKALRKAMHMSKTDIAALFDTGVFNDICKEYCRKAMECCEVDAVTKSSVIEEMNYLFDTISAADI